MVCSGSGTKLWVSRAGLLVASTERGAGGSVNFQRKVERGLTFGGWIILRNLSAELFGNSLKLLKVGPILAGGLADLTGKAFEALILGSELEHGLGRGARVVPLFQTAFLCGQHEVSMLQIISVVNHA